MVAGRVASVAFPAAALCLAAPMAFANEQMVRADTTGLYDGGAYSYLVQVLFPAQDLHDTAVIDLPAPLTLLGIDYRSLQPSGVRTSLFDTADATCNGPPPYDCPPRTVGPLANDAVFHVQPIDPGTGTQQVRVERRDSAAVLTGADFWEAEFYLLVRASAAPCGTDPRATFSGGALVITSDDTGFCTESKPSLTSLTATPGQVTLRRALPPTLEIIDWSGSTSQGAVVINDDVSITCSQPALCASGDPLQLVEELPAGRFPAQLHLRAFNNTEVSDGDHSVVISATHVGLPASDVLTVLLPEGDVSTFAISGPVSVGAGTWAVFTVAVAQNSNEGNEPRVIDAFDLAVAAGSDSPIGPILSYVRPVAGRSDAIEVRIPESDFPPTTDTLVFDVTAIHDNPTLPTDAQHTVQLQITRTTACVIEPSGGRLGVSSRTPLQLMRQTSTGNFLASGVVTWSIVAGAGEITGTGYNPKELVAPAEPGTVTVRADAPPEQCTPAPAPVTFEIARLVKVTLTAADTKLAPGGFTTLRGRVENLTGQDVQALRLRLDVGPALQALRHQVKPITAFVPRPVTSASSRVAAAAPASQVELELDLTAAEGVQEFSLPVAARMAAAGMTTEARLDAFYAAAMAAGEEPVDGARVRITVEETPELGEATLLGKVFNDKNGNGEQEPGEEGVASAMVALSTSVYALTDEHGRYHIARLQPGRVAVKLNAASLPLGTKPAGEMRREITLTPGMFSRVSFGVRLLDLDVRPLALVQAESGARVVRGKPVFSATVLSPPPRVVTAHQGKLVVAGRRQADRVTLDLPLGEQAYWLVVEREPDGRAYLSSLAVHVYARAKESALVVPWGPRPVASLTLPPSDALVSMDKLALRGRAPKDVEVRVGASLCERGAADAIHCEMKPEGPLHELALTVDPPADPAGDDPPAAVLMLPVKISGSYHFFVGLAGVELGHVVPRENGEDAWDWRAGGAFFYRGVIQGKYLLTAGADARDRALWVREDGKLRRFGGFASRLLGHDPRRVFRDLDPEAYYPVYGDASVTVDERESGGRFFARIEAGDNYLRWGGVNTAIDDAEVGRYVRSLYGLGGRIALGDGEDSLRMRAVMFAAQPGSAAARDELVVTGNTLYFLSHRDLVEGSLRVTLEMLDEISGLPVRATPLVEGSDYEADYAGGRIVLATALPYRAFGVSLTGSGSSGQRARLLLEYEYVPSALNHDWTAGGRAVATLGPLTLGATGVAELVPADDGAASLTTRYTLVGGTARLDLGEPLRLRLEFAHSDGGSYLMQRSVDGGLSFGEPKSGDERQGNAAAAELSTGFGGTRAAIYGRLVEPGFADSRHEPGSKLVQGGLRLAARLAATEMWANADHREAQAELAFNQPGETVIRQIGLLGVAQRLGAWRFAGEGRYESMEAQARALTAAEVRYRLTDTWSLTARRRQLLLDDTDTAVSGDTALGVAAQSDSLTLLAEGGMDDEQVAFGRVQGSLPADSGIELYAGYQVVSHLAPFDSTADQSGRNRIVAGGRQSLADGTLLYSEQSLAVDGSERVHSRTVGGRLPLSPRLAVSITYERGGLDSDDTSTRELLRDAAGVAATYAGERWSLRAGSDGRLDQDHRCASLGAARVDESDCRQTQLGGQARLELRLTDSFTLALAGRGASAHLDAGDGAWRAQQAAWEAALGFAVRPVDTDWLDVFARYALTHDRQLEDASDPGTFLDATSHLVAGAVVVDVMGPVSLSPKLAYAYVQRRLEGASFTDQFVVAALRSDVHLAQGFDLGVEGRSCAAPGSELDTRYGALAEASLLVMEWLRLGAGYNFSSISVSAARCAEPGARGVFVRAEAVY